MAFDEFVMLPECPPGPLLPLCALGRIRSASCRFVHCCGQCRSRCQALRTHGHVRWVAGVLAPVLFFPDVF
jgi:hypothetical protein